MASADVVYEELRQKVQQRLDERPPQEFPLSSAALDAFGAAGAAMDHAGRGFGLAVQALRRADYATQLQQWGERQRLARQWLTELQQAGPGGNFTDLRACIDEVGWDSLKQALVIGRRSNVTVEAYQQIRAVIDRATERLAEVTDSTRARAEQMPPDESEQRRVLAQQAHHEMTNIRRVGVQRINTQTRRVLDLLDSTATVTVDEWLARHGLDASLPPPE